MNEKFQSSGTPTNLATMMERESNKGSEINRQTQENPVLNEVSQESDDAVHQEETESNQAGSGTGEAKMKKRKIKKMKTVKSPKRSNDVKLPGLNKQTTKHEKMIKDLYVDQNVNV
jgi:hypothetical protein